MLDGTGDIQVGGWWIAGMVLMVVFWAAVIWLGTVLVRQTGSSGGRGGGSGEGDAVAIVRARYARGDSPSWLDARGEEPVTAARPPKAVVSR